MNRKLGKHATREIREAIGACMSRAEIMAEAARLAEHFGVRRNRIYEVTRDIRPRRAVRADLGRRAVDLKTDETLRRCAGWMLEYGLTPADSFEMARARGMEPPVTLATFRKYLREHGLDRHARQNVRSPYRRFEATAPGEMFQFDISGTKERWYDTRTRKILTLGHLDVSRNHPNTRRERVRIWRFVMTDDFSRKTFLRFYGCEKPTSSHVVEFLLEAYEEMGVPLKLYTDNDTIIKFGRNRRAAAIINRALSESGGYELLHHKPGNPRATGKVERRHQDIEKFERFIGVYLAERTEPLTLEILNGQFAPAAMERYNTAVNRETGETPEARWQSRISLVRRLDRAALRSAFLADEFDIRINDDLTFSYAGKLYQLPRAPQFDLDRLRFSALRRKVTVVFPDEGEYFTLIDPEGREHELPKTEAAPDRAGEYRSAARSEAARLSEELRRDVRRDARERRISPETSTGAIPIFDTPPAPPGNVAIFPKPEIRITAADVAPFAPVFEGANGTEEIGYWQAVAEHLKNFAGLDECKAAMDAIFGRQDAFLPRSAVNAGLRAAGRRRVNNTNKQ
jgi:hypothetical protein